MVGFFSTSWVGSGAICRIWCRTWCWTFCRKNTVGIIIWIAGWWWWWVGIGWWGWRVVVPTSTVISTVITITVVVAHHAIHMVGVMFRFLCEGRRKSRLGCCVGAVAMVVQFSPQVSRCLLLFATHRCSQHCKEKPEGDASLRLHGCLSCCSSRIVACLMFLYRLIAITIDIDLLQE